MIYTLDQLFEMLKLKCSEKKFFLNDLIITPVPVKEPLDHFPYPIGTKFKEKVTFIIEMMEN